MKRPADERERWKTYDSRLKMQKKKIKEFYESESLFCAREKKTRRSNAANVTDNLIKILEYTWKERTKLREREREKEEKTTRIEELNARRHRWSRWHRQRQSLNDSIEKQQTENGMSMIYHPKLWWMNVGEHTHAIHCRQIIIIIICNSEYFALMWC